MPSKQHLSGEAVNSQYFVTADYNTQYIEVKLCYPPHNKTQF